MPRRKIHPTVLIDDARLQRLGELDEPRHALGRAGAAADHNHRVLGGHEQPGGFADGAGIAGRRLMNVDLREAQPGGRLGVLHVIVDGDRDRPHGRRHRDRIRARGRFRKVPQRHRIVVPLRHVADDRGRILRAVDPEHLARALGRVLRVAEHEKYRHAIAPRVVDRHRRVLGADGPVHADEHGFALDLRVAVGHGHRDLFVRAGDAFGIAVPCVIDDRLMDADEARCAHGEHVFHVHRSEQIDHEVGRVLLRSGSSRRRGGLRLRVLLL